MKLNLLYSSIWEIYFIICISYLAGFLGGWFKAYFLMFSLLFLAIPFYLIERRLRK